MADPSTPVRHFNDGDALGRALAAEIAERIDAAFAGGDRFVLGCPGGRTPVTTYTALATEIAARGLDASGIVIAMMDDYLMADGDGDGDGDDGSWQPIDADAHNSCRRFAREEIQGALNRALAPERSIPDENVWFPDPANPGAYDARLAAAGGIDFFILASGAGDGHVAFNPPGSSIDSRSRVVELAEQTRRDNLATFPEYTGIDDVPTHGVTVGIATIAEQSKAAAMILIGADKRTAYRRLTADGAYDSDWPATVFHLVEEAALYADATAIPPEADTVAP